jgi:hypothetical protein
MHSACGTQALTAWLPNALSWFPTYWLKSKRLRSSAPPLVARGQGHLDGVGGLPTIHQTALDRLGDGFLGRGSKDHRRVTDAIDAVDFDERYIRSPWLVGALWSSSIPAPFLPESTP